MSMMSGVSLRLRRICDFVASMIMMCCVHNSPRSAAELSVLIGPAKSPTMSSLLLRDAQRARLAQFLASSALSLLPCISSPYAERCWHV